MYKNVYLGFQGQIRGIYENMVTSPLRHSNLSIRPDTVGGMYQNTVINLLRTN